jgi:6-pyruvoyltetrahydropterin/6-carboxytetrahydropterin synthase
MSYRSTKTYGHEIGLSAAFRQWRAKSHCHFIHGYALSIRFEFEAEYLDDNNWVIDFGSLKSLKAELESWFDHKLLVAKDDPELEWYEQAYIRGIADIVVVDKVGCEAFAELCAGMAISWLAKNSHSPRCRLVSVEVKEHGANSAIFKLRD